MNRIMIVDDEPYVLRALERSLRDEGWLLHCFHSAKDALDFAASESVDVVISDYRMPVMDGITFLSEMKKLQPDAFRIVLSGQADTNALVHAINDAEIYRFVAKPWCDIDLKITITKTLEHRDTLIENQKLAELVRSQEVRIDTQQAELDRLERESPGITQVNRDEDGCIICR